MKRRLILSLFITSVFASASERPNYETSLDFAQVTHVNARQRTNNNWCFDTSVQHNDQGWEHYADGWEVTDLAGHQLGHRVLGHPHDNEQPFTRNKCNIKIPADMTKVVVRAKCNKHGFGGKPVIVDLSKANGIDYSVSR